MLINAYLPTDPQTLVFDDAKLLEVLEEIRSLVQKHDFDYFCLLGDLNADFSRNSGHVKTIRRFKEELNLDHSWENFEADFSHVHELNGVTYVSLIDHFMWNVSLGELVSDSGVLHLLDNTSDHLPIYCNITVEDVVENLPSSQVKSAPKPSWKLASSTEKESFKSILCDTLIKLMAILRI